jgi:hypothetical protein
MSERKEKAPSDYVDSIIYLGEDRYEVINKPTLGVKKSILKAIT